MPARSSTTSVSFEYGDGRVEAELPADTLVLRAGITRPEPEALPDPVAATREAIAHPLDAAPLGDQVGPGSTVTVAFPDRVKGGAHATAHRKVALAAVLDELDRAGVRAADVRLVCAIGLHRKNRRDEFESYLGAETLARLDPAQVVNHDSEDPDGVVALPDSALGDTVEVNRALVESDLTVLIGHTAGNPYGGFSGGYKMPATGLTTWRSIRTHHTPASVDRDDFVPVSTRSRFRDQLRAIGEATEQAMPRPFFAVDAVLDASARQLGVFAGAIPAVEQQSWPLATARTELAVPGPPADVLVIGLPRTFHYGPGMGANPILAMQAVGASLVRAQGALQPDPVIIATAVLDGWDDAAEFPSYRATYERLVETGDPAAMTAFEDEFCTNADWVRQHREAFTYHPFHAFSMVYVGGLARRRAREVIIAGARDPGLARGMGAVPVPDLDAALARARELVDGAPRVIAVPELSTPAYHLVPGADR
ncbi:hypothetical protein FHX74_003426 [Friedmanniella endophytica]|uniref:LarA-like N-terminal domain-containing protein n=1 Tax=Microlunatus kandeliicorticis TaxID=1759536 RepID=A0A7W3IV76_9ACTN|nr:lactate racemase domain-containing protein [Microlunatus kandeliicorticis]MBA8795785.1 hypothetical protein [Microlunatus kandeliicorticis]